MSCLVEFHGGLRPLDADKGKNGVSAKQPMSGFVQYIASRLESNGDTQSSTTRLQPICNPFATH